MSDVRHRYNMHCCGHRFQVSVEWGAAVQEELDPAPAVDEACHMFERFMEGRASGKSRAEGDEMGPTWMVGPFWTADQIKRALWRGISEEGMDFSVAQGIYFRALSYLDIEPDGTPC